MGTVGPTLAICSRGLVEIEERGREREEKRLDERGLEFHQLSLFRRSHSWPGSFNTTTGRHNSPAKLLHPLGPRWRRPQPKLQEQICRNRTRIGTGLFVRSLIRSLVRSQYNHCACNSLVAKSKFALSKPLQRPAHVFRVQQAEKAREPAPVRPNLDRCINFPIEPLIPTIKPFILPSA